MANIVDVLNDGKFILNEGLYIFRNSKRFLKLASKMERSLQMVSDEREKEEVNNYIQNVKQASSEFLEVENAAQTGNRVEAKAAYDKLKIKYFKLVKDINTETMKKFILGAGIYIIFSVLIGGLGTVNAAQPATGQIDTRSITERIATNMREMKELKGENQKLGALEKNLKIMKDLEKKLTYLKGKTGVN